MPDPTQVHTLHSRLIPAGTGGMLSRLRQIANKRDKLIIEEQSKTQLPQAAAE